MFFMRFLQRKSKILVQPFFEASPEDESMEGEEKEAPVQEHRCNLALSIAGCM